MEGLDNCIIILDVHAKKNYRLINVYTSFVAPTNLTLKAYFERQVGLINVAISTFQTENIIIMGDFNLDYAKVNNISYNLWLENDLNTKGHT